MTKRKKRVDVHRPSVINPIQYEHVLSYGFKTRNSQSFGVNCKVDKAVYNKYGRVIRSGKHRADGLCCVAVLRNNLEIKWASVGAVGKCSVCSSRFVYGEIWKHMPSGEHIHIGHVCADKYWMIKSYMKLNQYLI